MKETEHLTQYFYTPSEKFQNSSIYITWAGHQHCSSEFSIGPRLFEHYLLVFVLNGKGHLETASRQKKTLHPGDLFVLYPGERHHYYADSKSPWEIMWIAFDGTLADPLLNDVGLTRDSSILRNTLTHSIRRTVQIIINSLGDTEDVNRLCATGQLYILFAYLKQLSDVHQQRKEVLRQESSIWKAIRFIEQYYYLDLDVDVLCNHVSYSRSYLSRTFKAETNMTIPEYVNRIRIQNSMNLLTTTKMSVKEIAISVGIKDSFYFSKLFKKITGETPREYRKNHTITP